MQHDTLAPFLHFSLALFFGTLFHHLLDQLLFCTLSGKICRNISESLLLGQDRPVGFPNKTTTTTKHWPSFLVCLDRTRTNPCTERSRLEWFRKTLAMGELSRDQVLLLSIRIHSGLSRGQLRCRGAWFEDPRTCLPNDCHPSTCISCTACCVAFKDFVVRRLQLQRRSSVLTKKSSVTPR